MPFPKKNEMSTPPAPKKKGKGKMPAPGAGTSKWQQIASEMQKTKC